MFISLTKKKKKKKSPSCQKDYKKQRTVVNAVFSDQIKFISSMIPFHLPFFLDISLLCQINDVELNLVSILPPTQKLKIS